MFSEVIGGLYKNHVVIGNGSFGKVFSAQRVTDSKTVAVKEVDTTGAGLAERMIILSEYTYYPNIVDPNVVTCYTTHFDETSGQLYIEMEYCPGGSLLDLIKSQRVKKQPLPERDVWLIFKGLASALVYLHSSEKKPSVGAIIHRDIKPANIVFSKDGVAKICDFGLSRGLHELSVASSRVGTDAYMAPEVDQGEYNEKVDVWSLGCVILELCSLHKPKPHEPIILEAYSPQLASILRRCLTVSPSDRISSAKLLHLLSTQEFDALSRKPSAYYGLDDNDEDTEEDAGDLELREQKEKIRAQEQKQQECTAETVEGDAQVEAATEVESLVFYDQNTTMPTLHTIPNEEDEDGCSQTGMASVIHEAPELTTESIMQHLDSVSGNPEMIRSLLLQYASVLANRDSEIAHLKVLLSLQNQQSSLTVTRPSVETPIHMSNDTYAESIDFTTKEPTQFATLTEKDSICPSPRSLDYSLGIVLDDLVANQYRLKANLEVDILQRSIKSKDAIIETMKKQTEVTAQGTKTFIDALYKDIKDLELELQEKDIIIEELCETIDKKNTLLDSAKKRESRSMLTDGSFTDRSKSATPEGKHPRKNSLYSPYSPEIVDREQEIQRLKDELIKQQTESTALREKKFVEQECIIQDLTASLRAANAEIDSLRQKVALQSPASVSSYANTPTVIKMPSLELSQQLSRINELEQINETLAETVEARDLEVQRLLEAMLHQEASLTKMREVSEAQRAENRKLQDAIRIQAGTISALVRKRSPQLPSNASPPSRQ